MPHAVTRSISPALDYVLVTRDAVDAWRLEAAHPHGRIGVFLGPKTGIHFCGDLDPRAFDFYVLPNFANGVLLFERPLQAYKAFREICPNWEIIF